MRGKHFHANAAPWADGITPADAGKTKDIAQGVKSL